MAARRLPGPPPDGTTGPLVRFTFDRREYEGVEGEPLAVALLAADRPILSRSFRFHRPRGLMCSTGQCGWCECEVDGVPSVRSCQVPVRAGLIARGEHAFPSVERDLLALLDAGSRWIPPTFYHHRFLRPRALRKRYLDVLRAFGGRGRLRPGERGLPARRRTRGIETEVLVVGGGRAGLEAALGAAEKGRRVVLIEAEATLGGRWRVGRDLETGDLARRVVEAGVEVLVNVAAVGWYDGMVAALGDEERLEVDATAVIAATGSYDRVPSVPGNDRPGVMAARTVAWLIDRHRILPGERALLVGEGADLSIAADRLERGGATCVGPIPTASLRRVLGGRHVTGAIVRDGRGDRREPADLIVFGDRSPNLDLVLAAGAAVEASGDTLVPVADATGRTSVPSLFVAGAAAGRRAPGVAGAADAAMAAGAMVCFCEDVRAREIHAERAAGYRDPELVKRRTGTLTGPCQGKYCLQAFACLVGGGSDETVGMPAARPPLRPVRLGDLVAPEVGAGDEADRV